MQEGAFRGWASRVRNRSARPVDLRRPAEEWPNLRTPLWDEEKIQTELAARPGKPGRPRKTPTTEETP